MAEEKKKKDIDSQIKKFQEWDEFKEGVVEQAGTDHDGVYVRAHDRVFGKKKGGIRYSDKKKRLKTKKGRQEFRTAIMDEYRKLVEGYGNKEMAEDTKKNPITRDFMINAFYKTNAGLVDRYLDQYKDRYTIEVHGEMKNNHLRDLSESLSASANEALKDVDKDAFMKRLDGDLSKSLNKAALDERGMASILKYERESGRATEKGARNVLADHYFVKEAEQDRPDKKYKHK